MAQSVKYKESIVRGTDKLAHPSKVMGMAIMANELFVVCRRPPNIIFKYELNPKGPVVPAPVELGIHDMVWPRGLAASEKFHCLYITDWSKIFGGRMWRYKHIRGQDSRWEPPLVELDVQPFGVSVSPKDDLILVTCATPINVFARKGWVNIYKPDGEAITVIKVVELPGLQIPRHSILTNSSTVYVCHGWTSKEHGVSAFSCDGEYALHLKNFHGDINGGDDKTGMTKMARPLSMTIDEDGHILVVDYNNHRIHILKDDLKWVRHLITKTLHGIEYPRHACLHRTTGKLYVGQNDGTVNAFTVCEPSV